MSNSRLPAIPAFLLSLALCACNTADNEDPPAPPEIDGGAKPVEITAMDREISALKSRVSDPAALEPEYRAILSRNGYAVPAPDHAAPMGPVSPADQAEAAGAPLAKTAAVYTAWKTVKDFDFGIALAFHHEVVVANNATITVYANRASSPTDPVLVAYYRTSGNAASIAYRIKAVAFNDDRGDGTRNAKITWKNTTGSPVILEIMAYAYSSATTGGMHITVLLPNSGENFSVPVYAYPEYYNSQGPFSNCNPAEATRIQLKRLTGGGFWSGVLALNYGTARGGLILENGGDDIQTLNLSDVITNDPGNFLMGVMLDTDELVYERTWFKGIQQDKHTCTLQPGEL
jgi:hypothetical protein